MSFMQVDDEHNYYIPRLEPEIDHSGKVRMLTNVTCNTLIVGQSVNAVISMSTSWIADAYPKSENVVLVMIRSHTILFSHCNISPSLSPWSKENAHVNSYPCSYPNGLAPGR